jgi:nucleoid DNA-binding protein
VQGTGVRHKTRKLVRSVFVQLVHVQYVVPPVPGEHPLFYALQLAYKTTKKTGEFVLPGFGKLVKQKRKARTGFNPKTQQKIRIPAKTVLKFRVAKVAKDTVLGVKK